MGQPFPQFETGGASTRWFFFVPVVCMVGKGGEKDVE
jgi:hypothetical protein